MGTKQNMNLVTHECVIEVKLMAIGRYGRANIDAGGIAMWAEVALHDRFFSQLMVHNGTPAFECFLIRDQTSLLH